MLWLAPVVYLAPLKPIIIMWRKDQEISLKRERLFMGMLGPRPYTLSVS